MNKAQLKAFRAIAEAPVKMTAKEMAETPHNLDLEFGDTAYCLDGRTYVWNKREKMWLIYLP